MSYKNNYTEDWEGKTGSQVAKVIQDALSEHGTALNDLNSKSDENIKDIQFDVDASTSTVTCTVVKGDDSTVEGTTTNKHKFTLKAVSTNTAYLDIVDFDTLSGGNTILKYGTAFTFTASWYILNANNVKLTGGTADLYVTVEDASGNKNSYKKEALPVTKTGTATLKQYTILASELPEGTCTITIDLLGSYGGATINSNNVPTFKLNVLNPKLTVSFDEGYGINLIKSMSDQFTWNFSVTDSKGKALLVNGTTVTATKNIYYGGAQSAALSVTDNSITRSLDDIRGSSSAQNGRQRIFVQAAITSNNVTIVSNIVLLYLMTDNATTTDYTYFALQFNDVASIGTGAPTVTVNQYDTTTFKVYAYNELGATLTYSLTKNGDTTTLTTADLAAGVITDISYSYIFKTVGNNTFKITAPSLSVDIVVNVQSIGSSMEELTSQVISLNAAGKSSTDRTWASGTYSVAFSGFDWEGNGWSNGGLLVNNNATAILPYSPFSNSVFTASFKLNASSSIEEEALISCKDGDTGFEIYPEKATFLINGEGISTLFNSTETHEITFVRYGSSYGNLLVIYVDGQAQMSKSVSTTTTAEPNIVISADSTLLYLYNINIFNLALSFTNVQSLYCFNQTNSEDILNYINNNNVFDSGSTMGTIGYKDGQVISPDSIPVGSHYMIISEYVNAAKTGDAQCEDPSPWQTIDEYPGEEADKYKGIYHLVGNVILVEKVEDGEVPSARNFLVDKACLAAQGTSSMAYPLKNFRLAFGKPIDSSCAYYNATGGSSDPKSGDFGYTTVLYTGVAASDTITTSGSSFADYKATYNGTLGTVAKKPKYPIRSSKFGDSVTSADAKIFCLKADYAESSGSHNTGYARLVNDALTNSANIYSEKEANSILPQQYVVNSMGKDATYKKEIRSTIDGYPIYLFFKKADGTLIYHGKYNFNNEKSSKDVFGFEKIHDYFNNQVVKEESNLLKKLFNDTNNYYDSTHFAYAIDSSGEYDDEADTLPYINPTECWEFSNNTFDVEPTACNVIGAFLYPYTTETSSDTFSYPLVSTYPNRNPFTVKDSSGALAWLSQAWEYRYPGLDDGSVGDLLYRNGVCKPFLLDSLYKWLYKHNGTLINYDNNTINDFAENLHKYFNVNFLLKYFVLTKWFGNVDQRIKNCMLSFYCDPTVDSNTDADSPMGHMRAFYIFYDNDTINGVDNAGTLTLEWNIDEDVYPGYGKHAIWDNLEYCYKYYAANKTEYEGIYNMGALIQKAYQALRKVITDDKITQYFDTDQVDKFPAAIHNLDAEIKYYYVNDINTTTSLFASNNIAKFQGNRKYHRKRWLKNRTNWFDAKFLGGNIDTYSYSFKVGGTSGITLPGGSISLTAAIKDWRFYITDSTSKLQISSKLLAKDETTDLTINANSFSISDFVLIESLYGCSAIDFTNFETSTWFLDLNSGGNTLPYLTKFVLNSKDNTAKPKVFSSAAFTKLLTKDGNAIFPNIEELVLCNTLILSGNNEASTRLPLVDLSTFNKLLKIDTTGTDVDVILPNSGSLISLVLESPKTLTITNKPSLNTITVGTDSLLTLNAGAGNSEYAYDWILSTAYAKRNTEGFTSDIVLGTKTQYYNITSTQIDILVDIANANVSNINISGYLYNSEISAETMDLLTSKYPSLVISTSSTAELTFNPSSLTLNEGSELVVTLTGDMLASTDKWYWAIYDSTSNSWKEKETLSNLIIKDTDNTTRTKLYLKATASGNNDDKTYRLRIGAYYTSDTEPTLMDKEVTITYRSVTSIKISAANNILDAGKNTTITFSCTPSNHTKTNWILANGTWTATGGTINASSSPVYYTKDTSTDDGSISLKVGGIVSNTINIIYDKELLDGDLITASADNLYRWVYNLLFRTHTSYYTIYTPVKISYLHDLNVNNNDLSSYLAYTYTDSQGNAKIVPQDLTYLQYVNYTDTTFTIPPSLLFTDLVIPDNGNITQVNWTPSQDYTLYLTIVFPSSLNQANISITNDTTILSNLCLDFSKTSITKIYNGNNNCDNSAASVSFTYSVSASDTNPSQQVFKFPSTLTTLGNYLPRESWNSTASNVYIFNLSNGDSTGTYGPLYIIPTAPALVNVGPIYGYTVNANSVSTYDTFELTAGNFKSLYYAFTSNNLPSGDTSELNFSNVTEIGNNSFLGISITTLTINSNVEYIGDFAFSSFNGTIKSSSIDNGRNVFASLKEIGNGAFLTVSKAMTIELKSLQSIGEYAFAKKGDVSFSHTIYLNLEDAFSFVGTSFGTNNDIYLSDTLKAKLQQSSAWSEVAATDKGNAFYTLT